MFVFVLFLFCSIFLFALLGPLFRVYVMYAMDMYVPVIISMQVIRDGTQQVVSNVPSRAGTAVHIL